MFELNSGSFSCFHQIPGLSRSGMERCKIPGFHLTIGTLLVLISFPSSFHYNLLQPNNIVINIECKTRYCVQNYQAKNVSDHCV